MKPFNIDLKASDKASIKKAVKYLRKLGYTVKKRKNGLKGNLNYLICREAWINYIPTYDFEYNCNIWVKRGETLTLPRDWDKLIEYTKREKPKYKKMKLDIKGLDVEDLTERWSSQLAQIDCRLDTCTFYNGSGECTNPSPAITLNPSGKFTCWSKNEVEKPKYKNSSYYWVNDDGTWKPAQRGDKVWHFMHYAAREEDVMEVGEEIKRNK